MDKVSSFKLPLQSYLAPLLNFLCSREMWFLETAGILFYVNWQSFSRLTDLVTPKWHTLWIVLLCGKGRYREEEKPKAGSKGKVTFTSVPEIRAKLRVMGGDKTITLVKWIHKKCSITNQVLRIFQNLAALEQNFAKRQSKTFRIFIQDVSRD